MTRETLHEIAIPPEAAGERLDKALARLLPEMSRARLQALIAEGRLAQDGRTVIEARRAVKAGEAFTLTVPPPRPAAPEAQRLPLDIVFEDEHLIVIDKPAGLVVHPAAGNRDGTLVNALLAHCGGTLMGIGGEERPGIVHRLDKDTSGLLVAAKSDAAHKGLSEQFAARTIERVYTAYVWGVPKNAKGRIEGAIGRSPTDRRKMAIVARGGKAAVTYYEVSARFGLLAARIACRLETGRTHQIRVHMASITHPLVGDPVYGKGRRTLGRKGGEALEAAIAALAGQALHAGVLGFTHPVSRAPLRFERPMPQEMLALEAALQRTKL